MIMSSKAIPIMLAVAASAWMYGDFAAARDAAAPVPAGQAATKKPATKPARPAPRRPPAEADPLADAPRFSAEAVGWQLVEDVRTGARLGVPEKLTPHVGAVRSGTRWSSTQGQIQVETFRLGEAALPALFEDEKRSAHRQVISSSLKPDGFVILGVQGLKNFLVRAEARGSEVRGVTVLYDQATEGTMGPVALAIANAFIGFPDPNAAPPPGLRRRVEYGSAIVVSADGALIAAAHTVDDCQAITVPPFGHAARVAEDKASGLALIRLYGMHDLTPVSLADAAAAADVMVVGIADPLTQTGDGRPASLPAHLSGRSIEPEPARGFSGAAVVDDRDRVVGIVDLAGAVAGRTAALVPVDAIRAFLQAQHV